MNPNYDYLIMRNTSTPRLFDVVMVDFHGETAVKIQEQLPFDEAAIAVEVLKGS